MNGSNIAWTDTVTAIVAIIALILSLVGLYFSWQAHRLTHRQERRRQPNLIPAMLHGYVRTDEEGRTYAFHLSVSNPTDSDNAVAAVDLCITYLTPANMQMTLKLPSSEAGAAKFPHGVDKALAIPMRVTAHDTISGWCYFHVAAMLLKDIRIEGYNIVLADSHNMKASVEPIIVQEYCDEIQNPPRRHCSA